GGVERGPRVVRAARVVLDEAVGPAGGGDARPGDRDPEEAGAVGGGPAEPLVTDSLVGWDRLAIAVEPQGQRPGCFGLCGGEDAQRGGDGECGKRPWGEPRCARQVGRGHGEWWLSLEPELVL